MLVDFSESPENQGNVIGVIGNGFDYLPWVEARDDLDEALFESAQREGCARRELRDVDREQVRRSDAHQVAVALRVVGDLRDQPDPPCRVPRST